MMLSLVDYGGSSDSEDEEVSETPSANPVEKAQNSLTSDAQTAAASNGSITSDSTSTSLPFDEKVKQDGLSKFKVDEDEVEDSLRMRMPGNLRKSDIMKPPPRRRKKGKVTITAFNLQDDSDSDEADDGRKAAPVKASSSQAHKGLASLLPAPRAMIVREGNKPMIPHAVSRAAPAKKAAAAAAKAPLAAKEPEAPQMKSFFEIEDEEDAELVAEGLTLCASGAMGPQRPPANCPTPMETEPSSSFVEPSISEQSSLPEELIPEAERKRLQRKRQYGEVSGIIDIRQEQLTAGADIEFTKTISQEEDEWAKKRHNEALPSKMAARKHQITWLAYRAKEQEFELKNSWATAKHNKMETRNKYGF